MASIVVNGDTSGAVTLSAPAVAGTVTVTLPSANGTMLTTASSTGISGSAISSGTVPEAYGGTGTSTGYYGFKNRIINGAMVIDQRNAGSAVTVNNVGIFSADRWANVARATGGGVYSAQQVSDAPTGFNNSLKLTVTTVDTSLGTSDYYFSWQKIEGFNTTDLMFGTANAKAVTLSFWVKSNITGQFSVFLSNATEVYNQPFAYTVNAANTWEFKTITFTGATAGTWVGATNGVGLMVGFGLANGTSLQGTSGVWTASSVYGSTGDVNWMATLSNTFQITGVQLEKGSTATSFDYRPYGTEFMLCQRYFEVLMKSDSGDGNRPAAVAATTSDIYFNILYKVNKRTSGPTVTFTAGEIFTGSWSAFASPVATGSTDVSAQLTGIKSGLTQNAAYLIRNAGITVSAEL